MDQEQELEKELQQFRATFTTVREEIGKYIVGNDELVTNLLIACLAGGNVLLEGVPGLGKTTLVRCLSQALSLSFSRIQFTPDLMPADITGTHILTENEQGRRVFSFRQGPLFAHLVLADEINRATPKTQSAMLEAMQEHSVTVAGEHHQLEEPFFVLATQNPIEMEGTYPLPEAQLDRFFFKLLVAPPDEEELGRIIGRTTGSSVPQLSPVLDRDGFLKLSRLARGVLMADHVQQYIARLILATHPDRPQAPEVAKKYVRFGSSPRGGQVLALAGKVRAVLDGRTHVAAEDVRASFLPALRHRLILNFEGEAAGVSTDSVLTDILAAVPEPA